MNLLHTPISLRSKFFKLRPFVRSGEDFLLLQELIDKKVRITSQTDFDTQIEKTGTSQMSYFRELFYAARSEYLNTDRDYWMSLNRLYPHIQRKLPLWADSPCFYIISTKKSEYILEILKCRHIEICSERVLYCKNQSKQNLISNLLDKHKVNKAVFIDDQIDHLLASADTDLRIEGFLASWGYVQKEWLKGNQEVQIITPGALASKMDSLIQDCLPERGWGHRWG